jgi:hypothetical protein
VSLECCHWTGTKLADNSTCGARCQTFPNCLPPPSPQLAQRVAAFHSDTAAEYDAAETIADVLAQLHDAIAQGLERKEQRWGP